MSQGIIINVLLRYIEIIHFPHFPLALLPYTDYMHKHTHADLKSTEQIVSDAFRVAQRHLLIQNGRMLISLSPVPVPITSPHDPGT